MSNSVRLVSLVSLAATLSLRCSPDSSVPSDDQSTATDSSSSGNSNGSGSSSSGGRSSSSGGTTQTAVPSTTGTAVTTAPVPTGSTTSDSSDVTASGATTSESQTSSDGTGSSEEPTTASESSTSSTATDNSEGTSDADGSETSDQTSGTDSEVDPSPGCAAGGARPNNGSVYVANESWLTFPETYDGETPYPVLFGFHGCGTGNRGDGTRTEYTDETRNNILGREYVVAVPIAADAGGCWNYNNDIPRVRALYDELVNNYCVDMNQVFATGHSSGAYFAVAVLEAGHATDAEYLRFRGMAPVAASPVNNHATPMPVLYIENPADTERGDNNADMVVAGYLEANMCTEATMPYEGVDGCNSSSGGAAVNPGCVMYEGCSEPTIWCSHNDQAYGTTGHGIPCFAAQAMDMFFKSL